VRPSPPPPKRSEAFPPPEEPIAGPSRVSQTSETVNSNAKGKRKNRRQSTESSSRNPSPARSTSPVKEKKKRARISNGTANGGDDETTPSKGVDGKEDAARLGVPQVERRSKSPGKGKVTTKKGDGNPLWVAETDIGFFTEHRDFVCPMSLLL